MKKIFVLITILFFIYSCQNTDSQYKKKIVGKYYTIDYEEFKDEFIPFSVTSKFYEEFLATGYSKQYETLKISILIPEGNNVIIQYELQPILLRWDIKDGLLYYNYDVNNVNIELQFKHSTAKNYIEKAVVSKFREFIENNIVDVIEQDMFKEDGKPVEIVELTTNRLVTKDSEGQETIQKRIE